MLSTYAIIAVVSYLLGSIPFGYILMRVFRGEDVRASGSGNIGATNVARKAPGLGIATLLLDAAKGFAAVIVAYGFFRHELLGWAQLLADTQMYDPVGPPFPPAPYLAGSIAAICAILGHMFPVWLRFRGGKGVATGVGAFLALAPNAIGAVLLIFIAVVIASRYVSLGSIAAAAAFPLFAYILNRKEYPPPVLLLMALASALIILKHHQNIRRLLAGTENRLELKRTRA
ncbi:MAG: glycerol-3-phosphate 1-O-acyltransferase PlsY [Acidobacteriia bacterium]|nr:glycerol-3-phosphate 1-O-acyltransferase PlsY [Terriglobia bacterium]